MLQITSLSSYILTKYKQGISGLLYLDKANPLSNGWTESIYPGMIVSIKTCGTSSRVRKLNSSFKKKKEEDYTILSLVGQRPT